MSAGTHTHPEQAVHQTSGSHTGLYITLGTVAVLGTAAAVVVVVLRKQKKA